jgi:hypothetical protein
MSKIYLDEQLFEKWLDYQNDTVKEFIILCYKDDIYPQFGQKIEARLLSLDICIRGW